MVEQRIQSVTAKSSEVPARILKKRESDRRCQRLKREKTKTKIASLEEQVRSLGHQDATGQVQTLMQQLQKTERERDQLATKVKAIESVIKDGEGGMPRCSSDGKAQIRFAMEHSFPSSVLPSKYSHTCIKSPFLDESSVDASQINVSMDMNTVTVHETTYDTGVPTGAFASSDSAHRTGTAIAYPQFPVELGMDQTAPLQPCECYTVGRSAGKPAAFNTWRFANEALSSRFAWPSYFSQLHDYYKDDVPVRAIVEGWDAIEDRGPLHPTWQIMKSIDQNIVRHLKPKERLAIHVALHLLLMSHTSPETASEVPDYYQKRPSQDMADSYAIHFFPWPGMRERWVFSQHRYCTNQFWRLFLDNLVLVWPFEFRDCYLRNTETGMYSISPSFQERIKNISFWTMGEDLFMKWPELRADIPAYNSIPGSVSVFVPRPRFSRRSPCPVKNFASTRACQTSRQPVDSIETAQAAQSTVEPGKDVYVPCYAPTMVPVNPQKTTSHLTWTGNVLQQSHHGFDSVGSVSEPMNIRPLF